MFLLTYMGPTPQQKTVFSSRPHALQLKRTRQQITTEFFASHWKGREVTNYSQDSGPNCSLATLSNLLLCRQQGFILPSAYVLVEPSEQRDPTTWTISSRIINSLHYAHPAILQVRSGTSWSVCKEPEFAPVSQGVTIKKRPYEKIPKL